MCSMLKRTRLKTVDEESRKVGLNESDAIDGWMLGQKLILFLELGQLIWTNLNLKNFATTPLYVRVLVHGWLF